MLFPACLMTPTASSTFLGVLPLMVTSLSFSRTPNLAACPDKSRNKEKLRWTHWDKPIVQQIKLCLVVVVVKNMVEWTHMMTEVSSEKSALYNRNINVFSKESLWEMWHFVSRWVCGGKNCNTTIVEHDSDILKKIELKTVLFFSSRSW